MPYLSDSQLFDALGRPRHTGDGWSCPRNRFARERLPIVGRQITNKRVLGQWAIFWRFVQLAGWVRKGIIDLDDTLSQGGCYVCRGKKRTNGSESTTDPSMHGTAAAWDINPSHIPFGVEWDDIPLVWRRRQASIARLAAVCGLRWLPHDRMHFQPAAIWPRWRIVRAWRVLANWLARPMPAAYIRVGPFGEETLGNLWHAVIDYQQAHKLPVWQPKQIRHYIRTRPAAPGKDAVGIYYLGPWPTKRAKQQQGMMITAWQQAKIGVNLRKVRLVSSVPRRHR